MNTAIDYQSLLPEPQLTYTVRTFCDATGLSSTHVWDAISKQHLGTVKVGGRRLIPGKLGHAYLVELLASGVYKGPVPSSSKGRLNEKIKAQVSVASTQGVAQ
jgi:hypothetical protein